MSSSHGSNEPARGAGGACRRFRAHAGGAPRRGRRPGPRHRPGRGRGGIGYAQRNSAGDLYRQRQSRRDRRPRKSLSASVVVMDCPVSPVQQRNLEKAWNTKVIDRTGLILEIFGRRARTREGALQVELAHLTYQKSRLVRSWTHLERQRGGFGFLGGPGETQIEADRRVIEERSRASRRSSTRSSARASCTATAASACLIRSSRWSAIPMPANRRCSIA